MIEVDISTEVPGDLAAPVVEILLSGIDSAIETDPAEDLSVPATPPQAVSETLKASDVENPESEGVIDILAEPPSPAPVVKPKKAAANADKTGKKDRVTAFADRVAQERVQALLGDDLAPILAAMAEAPKKVSEKVYNVLCHVAGRGKLSSFTKGAFNCLRATGTVTSVELVALFKSVGYSEATARSQAQQQMAALPILGIATRDGSNLAFAGGKIGDLIIELDGGLSSDEELLEAASTETIVEPEDEALELLEAADEGDVPEMMEA